MVGRGPHLAAIREHGPRVVGPDGTFASQLRATDRPDELEPQDYVFITLKSHQVGPALDGIATLIGPETAVIPPTTGIPHWYFHSQPWPLAGRRLVALDPGGRQWGVLGRGALGCVYWVATKVEAHGVIRHDGAGASFPVGEPDGTLSAAPRTSRRRDARGRPQGADNGQHPRLALDQEDQQPVLEPCRDARQRDAR